MYFKLGIDNLNLTKSGYFYHYNDSDGIIKIQDFIKELLDTACRNKIGDYILDYKSEKPDSDNRIYYIRVFKTYREVFFLKPRLKPPSSQESHQDYYNHHVDYINEKGYFEDLNDVIYAYIIIVKYKNYLCILKKSCANILGVIEKYNNVNLIGLHTFGKLFQDKDTEYKKIDFRMITSTRTDIYSKTLYSDNLIGQVPLQSAGRSIISGLQIKNKNQILSISNTGRLTTYSSRMSFPKILDWIKSEIDCIDNSSNNNPNPNQENYLNYFAQKVEFSEIKDKIDSHELLLNSFLIDTPKLLELLEELSNGKISYKKANNDYIELDYQSVISLINNSISDVMEISNNDSISIQGYEIKDNAIIVVKDSYCNKSYIKINNKSITFNIEVLNKLIISENGIQINLNKLIIKNNLYSIGFNDFRYLYFMKECFKDNSGKAEVMKLLDIFETYDMGGITSEKGKCFDDENFDKSLTCFPKDSMFHFIENLREKTNNDDYIFCDDLGDEWADHITFNKDKSQICFIHSKHASVAISASDFHEVVGQGMKNLGNMFFQANQFFDKKIGEAGKSKSKKFRKEYSSTSIKRLRKGSLGELKKYINTLLSDPNLKRYCILSCSFVSKRQLEDEFKKMTANKSVRGEVIQLFWILSSFVCACREKGVIPIIYCQK